MASLERLSNQHPASHTLVCGVRMGTPATEEQELALKQALEAYPVEHSKDGASMDMQRVRWASTKLTAEHKLLSKAGLQADVAAITAQIPKKSMPKPVPSVLGLVSPQPQQVN